MPESKGPFLLRNTAMLNTQGWCISSPTRADVINMLTYSSVPDAYHALNFHSVFLRVRNLKMEHQVGLRVECHVIRSMHQYNAGASYEAIACLCNAEQHA